MMNLITLETTTRPILIAEFKRYRQGADKGCSQCVSNVTKSYMWHIHHQWQSWADFKKDSSNVVTLEFKRQEIHSKHTHGNTCSYPLQSLNKDFKRDGTHTSRRMTTMSPGPNQYPHSAWRLGESESTQWEIKAADKTEVLPGSS